MGIFSNYTWKDWALTAVLPGYYNVYKYLRDKMEPPKPGRIPQTSCYGRALPIVWGKTRLTGNMIYRAQEVYEGIGGLRAGFPALVALCEGPITGIGKAWRDGKRITAPSTILSVFTGTRPTQTAWTELSAPYDLGYPGVAMLGNDWPLVGAGLGRWSFEVKGLLHGTGGSAGDADPAQVIADALSDEYYGAAFTPDIVTGTGLSGDAASSYERWVDAMELWVSPAWTEQRPVADHLRELLDATYSDALWSEGDLKILPLGDQAVTGGGVTFTPYTTVQYSLTATDIIRDGDSDPITCERTPESDVYNCAPVTYLERLKTDEAAEYNQTTVEDPDPYYSQTYGLRRAPTATYDSVCLKDVALKLSRLRAQRWVWRRNSYRFSLPWRFCRLEPFDLVTIPFAGTTKTVRILSVRESDSHDRIEFDAEDWVAGTCNAAAHTTQSSDGGVVLPNDVQAYLHETAASVWVQASYGGSSIQALGCCWHEATKTFVAVGLDSFENGGCMWRRWGSTWTSATSSPAFQLNAVASDGVTCVAVGNDFKSTTSQSAYSTDGDTWTAATTDPATNQKFVVACSVGNFASAGSNGTDAVCFYSSDSGDTWSASTGEPTWKRVWGLARSGATERLVMIGNPDSATNGTGCWEASYSDDDGATWSTAADLPRQSGVGDTIGYFALAWGNGVFVAVGANNRCATSADGVTWTESPSPPTGDWELLGFTGRVFVAWGGTAVRTSRDGESWTPAQAAVPTMDVACTAWGPPGGVLMGYEAWTSGTIATY